MDLPMDEHLTAFLADLAAEGKSPGTITLRHERIGAALTWLRSQGVRRVADLRASDLDQYLHHLTERGLARETLRSIRTGLRLFCGWLHDRGLILVDPSLDLEIGTRDEAELPEQPLSEAEVSALLAAVPRRNPVDLRNRAMMELFYGCGLRLTECIELRLADLDLTRRVQLVHGKGDKERLLPVLPSAAAALADYLALRRCLLRGPDPGWLFLSRSGGRMSTVAVEQYVSRLGAKVLGKQRGVHVHLLRHSIAVHLLRGGADIRHIQEFLGHADLETTKIYLRLVPGHLREDYDKAMPELADGAPESASP
jgi:integrase/recombinase XerD